MQIPEGAKKMLGGGLNVAMATIDEAGMPNVVPMLQYWWLSEDTMVIGDMFMKATRANVQANGRVCISVWQENEAYKLKGTANYETSGPAYDLANNSLHEKKPDKDFKGVVVFKVTEVYNASRGPEAGELMVRA